MHRCNLKLCTNLHVRAGAVSCAFAHKLLTCAFHTYTHTHTRLAHVHMPYTQAPLPLIFQKKKTLDFLHWPLYRALCWLVFCEKKKPLDFLHCYHHSIVPFSAWLGFCGWFMPIITGLFVVGLFWCCWSLLFTLIVVSFAAWLGFCGWFMPIITGLFFFFFCDWPMPIVNGIFFSFFFWWLVHAHYLSLCLLVSFVIIVLFCSCPLPKPLLPKLPTGCPFNSLVHVVMYYYYSLNPKPQTPNPKPQGACSTAWCTWSCTTTTCSWPWGSLSGGKSTSLSSRFRV